MPGFDRTGPTGEGSGTGWGRGLCGRPGTRAGALGSGPGRGVGRGGAPWGGGGGRCFGGRGGRRGAPGRGNFFAAQGAGETEELKAALSSARAEIAAMESRLRELEKDK